MDRGPGSGQAFLLYDTLLGPSATLLGPPDTLLGPSGFTLLRPEFGTGTGHRTYI